MLLAQIATTSEDVRATSARGAKVARLVECLAALAPDEVPAGVAYLSGRLLQRQRFVFEVFHDAAFFGCGAAFSRSLCSPSVGADER